MADLVKVDVNIGLIMKKFEVQNVEIGEENNTELKFKRARLEELKEVLLPYALEQVSECQIMDGRLKYLNLRKLIQDEDDFALVKRA